jgi:phosphoribosylformylglycinamidine cyclo-ligase
MMKNGLTARIDPMSFPRLPIFDVIQEAGDIPTRDMYNTFNMGIGMVVALPREQVRQALEIAVQSGQHAYVIGTVTEGEEGHRGVVVEGIGEA